MRVHEKLNVFLKRKRLIRNMVNIDHIGIIHIFIRYTNAIQTEVARVHGVIDNNRLDVYIARIDVTPSYQKQGIGSQLLRDVCQVAKKKYNINNAHLISHLGAVRFYQNNGFHYKNKRKILNYIRTKRQDASIVFWKKIIK